MRWLQPSLSAVFLLPLGSHAYEKPLVDDDGVNWAEACPDYAKYSKYHQYVWAHWYVEQEGADTL